MPITDDPRDERIRELECEGAFFRAAVVRLTATMGTRATIEQAKGVVIALKSCTPDEAFEVLRRASKRENRKVRDIAAGMVADAGDVRRLG